MNNLLHPALSLPGYRTNFCPHHLRPKECPLEANHPVHHPLHPDRVIRGGQPVSATAVHQPTLYLPLYRLSFCPHHGPGECQLGGSLIEQHRIQNEAQNQVQNEHTEVYSAPIDRGRASTIKHQAGAHSAVQRERSASPVQTGSPVRSREVLRRSKDIPNPNGGDQSATFVTNVAAEDKKRTREEAVEQEGMDEEADQDSDKYDDFYGFYDIGDLDWDSEDDILTVSEGPE